MYMCECMCVYYFYNLLLSFTSCKLEIKEYNY